MSDQPDQPAPPRVNAAENETVQIAGLTFRFTTAAPTEPFEVLIGPDPETTDLNLLAAIKAAAAYIPPAIAAAISEPEPEPEPPNFNEWYGRVQKWAQFHGRPIPQPDEAENFLADFDAGTSAPDAAKKHCA